MKHGNMKKGHEGNCFAAMISGPAEYGQEDGEYERSGQPDPRDWQV